MFRRCTQEAAELVTCSLCPSEFSRKEGSAIIFENRQPDGRSSTSCAICPACASKVREHDPCGVIKDMDEIREHVKRMKDYTEGVEEAYDELLDEFEETKAANKDMEKKIEILKAANKEIEKEIDIFKAANKELQKKIDISQGLKEEGTATSELPKKA